MKIRINNCSSPGASFTKNTENVVLSCYEWIQENQNECKPFINFRKEASSSKGFNDNNARNIYPLLLKANFVKYQAGTKLKYNEFFTNLGIAYVKSIQLEINIKEDKEYDENIKKKAIIKANKIKEEIIYKGITNILNSESKYRIEMVKTLQYINKFKKIDKYEFAYLLYCLQTKSKIETETITEYRNKKIKFDVEINVRNDINLRDKAGESRNEGIEYLTSFSYFISLFEQAGLVYKNKEYYEIDQRNTNKIDLLLGGKKDER